MSLRFRLKKAEAIIWSIALTSVLVAGPFSGRNAKAQDGNKVVFAYSEAVVHQEIDVPENWDTASTLTATVSAAEAQDWKVSSDVLAVAINLYGEGGGGIYSHSTGYLTLTDGGVFNDYTLTITAAGVGSGWADVASVRLSIIGQDGEFWAGNYGTQVESASLELDGVELLANTEFVTNTGWVSSLGWQTCSGNAGGQPCVGLSAVEINNPTTTTTESTTTTSTVPEPVVMAFPDAGFESNNFDGWNKGSQTGTLGASITSSGTGVSLFSGSKTFTHGSRNAVGSPTVNGSPNPYYAPAVSAGSWTFSPNNASYAALLQPKNEQTFAQAMTALGLSGTPETAIRAALTADAQAASNGGSPTPTDAAWITREVEMVAGNTYTMSWNYVGTDYVPFNDGSITSLVAVDTPSTPTITVNNFNRQYALLGFTNPGTGDYSVNSFGSTGWQMSTYEVSVTGTYKLGFAVFNLGDTSLSPVLMVDNSVGNTDRCVPAGSNCTSFGGVAPNNETAPTVVPTTSTSTTTSTTTTTLPAATSLEVTSLLDDGSNGTLRWAITQANAQAGGIYDSIVITQAGTITLTSDLPAITAGVSITGTGRNTTIIDGNNLYRQIYSSGARTVTIQDLTLKQGKNVSWNGGTIYNSQGTFTITNVHITASPGWAFYQHGGGVTTFNNCLFTFNNAGVTSDHGSTPSSKSLTDTDYTNRIYVNNSQFSDNTYGIFVERFVRINASTFQDNTVGAFIRGLNRQQVYNSQFTDNGTALSFSSWIPTTWTPGADNQLVEGNNFNGNGVAIQFGNNFNNGSTTFNGVSANSWSTSRSNTFNENAVIYSGQGYVVDSDTVVTTTTTTVPQTTTTTTTTVPVVESQPEPGTTVPTPEPEETTPESSVPENTLPEETIPEQEDLPSPETTIETPEETTPPSTLPAEDETETEAGPSDEPTAEEEDTQSVIDALPDDASPEETAAVVTQLLESLPQEELAEAVAEIIESIADVAAVDELTEEQKEQIVAAVSAIIENGVTEEVAETLASNAAVLESISSEQAEQVFTSVEAGQLTEEVAAAIVDAVQEAPSEIREVFEDVVDLFQGAFDDYMMLNQNISVSERRTVIAAGLLTASAASMAAAGAMPSGSSPSSGPKSPTTRQDTAARREDEEEPSGEIAGDGLDWIKKISIYKYVDGVKMMDWFAFFKKFSYGLMNMGFTIAGSLVVYLTLSGPIQKIAGISTVLAIAAAMWLHMKEPTEE